MPRILRNYLISFLIIALFALVVTLIDRWADEREARTSKAAGASPATGAAVSGSPAAPVPAPSK